MTARASMEAAAAAAPPDPARVAEAHRAILADKTIQFDLPTRHVETRDAPEWLKSLGNAIGRFVRWVGDGWTVIGWIAVAVVVVVLLFALVPSLREWAQALLQRGRRGTTDEAASWAPTEVQARALLEEADALAAGGRYDEAVHLILFRSIDDIAGWRGELVRPSSTSRDIARAEGLPGEARGVFARIVAAVERSWFGGQALGPADWDAARADYVRFALKAA
ncbi:DUF4129 domain-containing protein [Sphingomonas sp. PL-96]|uniref:DUF4129 domain-containing protein n=1 Tax=Sphingomonas sp. PL-96 TaxID=2887201 RepID=UPI001E44515A|nr:DUF4129 domain-containing protein [Sphingomonas sp. PL-96]MCC2977858.1 DUF4129 domain-containing protein [Sphingomonas sp. PL-96]